MKKIFLLQQLLPNDKAVFSNVWPIIAAFLFITIVFVQPSHGQNCTGNTPSISIDLSSSADATWETTTPITPAGQCCGAPASQYCVELSISLHPDANAVSIIFTNSPAGSTSYQLNCGPSTGVVSNTIDLCVDNPGPHTVTFCNSSDPEYELQILSHTSTLNVTLDPFTPRCITSPGFFLGGGNPFGGNYYVNGYVRHFFDPNEWGPGDHEIVYNYNDVDAGCNAFATQSLTIVPLPEISWSGQEICMQEGWVDLTLATPEGGYYWGEHVLENQFNVGGVIPGKYAVSYTYSDAYGCSATDSAYVTVHDLPVADAGPDQDNHPYNTSITFSAASGGSSNYHYSWEPAHLFVNPNLQNPTTGNLTQSTRFTLNVTDLVTGCISTDEVIVSIVGGPVHITEVITNPSTICSGSSAELLVLSGGGSGNYDYEWSSDPHDPSLTPQINDPSPTVSPTQTTEYTITIRDQLDPTATVTANIWLQVNPLPYVTLDPIPPVCANTPGYALPGGDPLDGTFSIWDTNGNILNLPYINFSNFLPHKIGAGSYIVRYEVTNEHGCSNYAERPLEILPYVNAEFFTSFTDICISHEVTLLNHSKGADSYQWNFGDGNDSDTQDTTFMHSFTLLDNIQEYTISLTAHNDEGCSSTRNRKVKVTPPISAQFSVDQEEGCSAHTVTFNNESEGPIQYYFWDFGDGTSSLQQNPVHTYINRSGQDTTYTVSLTIVSTNFFCTETYTRDITVNPYIEADFSFSPLEGCHPFEVAINDLSFGADTYEWDFGNGETSNNENPGIRTFLNDTDSIIEYTITQKVINNELCSDSTSAILKVYPNITADFHASLTEGCAPLEVTFTNASSVTASEYRWEFGDGGSSSAKDSLVHKFENTTNASITYTVWLKVTSDNLCQDSISMDITVHPFIKADFDFHPGEACNPHEVTISNTSYGVTDYLWDFGNATSTTNDTIFTQPFEHNDTIPVTYDIFLQVENTQGCMDSLTRPIKIFPKIQAGFTAIADLGCNQLEVQFETELLSTGVQNYLWDFGDGGSSNLAEPFHIFKNTSYTDPAVFDVWLHVESEFLCKDSIMEQITVYPAIKADFSIENNQGCSPFILAIDNHSLGATDFYWDFGDGSVVSNESDSLIYHTFVNDTSIIQKYSIELLVENNDGCMDTLSKEITVFPQVTADFSSLSEGCHPLEVSFTNDSENAQYYFWDFGDETNSNLIHPTHTFYNLSHFNDTVYNIELYALSSHGCFASTTSQVEVFPKPNASFNIENSPGCSPYEIIISNKSLGVDTYSWDFGDGSDEESYSDAIVTHMYNHPHGNGTGYFNIELVGETVHGCTDRLTQQAIIYPNIEANFTSNITEGCHPLTIDFTNDSYGADRDIAYLWDYGDGSTSTIANKVHSHTFKNFSHTTDTTYRVVLVAKNKNNCPDTTHLDITVLAKPLAFFNIPHIQACAPYEINIHNFSVGASNYNWDMNDGASYTYNTSHFTHTYNLSAGEQPTFFNIDLEVQHDNGCVDQYNKNVRIFPEVVADFVSDTEGCHPYTTVFENNSTGADLYLWNFGNGNTSQSTDPGQTFLNHSHTETQTYTVSLTGESVYGCSAHFTRDIVVRPVPKAAFELSQLSGCSPFTPTISDISVGASGILWEIADDLPDSAVNEFSHTWHNYSETPDNHTLNLSAWNEFGCETASSQTIKVFPEVVADYTSENNIWEGCSPLTLRLLNNSSLASNYQWDFGEGNSATSANPLHIFRNDDIVDMVYPVMLEAKSIYGCKDTIYKDVTVFASPDAFFTAQPISQPYPNTIVTMTNQTSPGPWSFHWEFGDGNYTQTQSFDPFDHNYIWDTNDMSSKTYTIALRAENENCSDLYMQDVTITTPVPIARFSSDETVCTTFSMEFYNRTLYAHTFRWDFGDESISTEPNPTHIYMDHGIYNVTLIAIGDGGRDTINQTIVVHENPTANFELKTTLIKIPEEPLRVVNLSKLGDFYLWDFGDGNTSNAFEPQHYYRKPGIYDISLKVTRDTQPQCHDTLKRANALRADETCKIIFPNAFKPSHSGPSSGHYDMGNPSTEIFHPVHEGVDDYALEIYNRWGELIFRSDDINIGWDGYIKDRLAKMDVYVWKVTGRCTDGASIILAGDVTLYR